MLSPFTVGSSASRFENSNVTSPSSTPTILTESKSLTIQSGSAALTCSAVWLGRLSVMKIVSQLSSKRGAD